MRGWRPWLLSLLMLAGPATAFGQDVTIGAGAFVPAFTRVFVPPDGTFPSGSVAQASVSFGSMLGTVAASIRLPLRPRLWLEGDWTRAAGSGRRSFELANITSVFTPGGGFLSRSFTTVAESRATNVVAVNLLRSVGTGRVSTVFGVGAAIRRTDAALDVSVRCEPVAPTGCTGRISDAQVRVRSTETGVNWQALMGIDAAVTDRASLLLNVRWMRLGEISADDERSPGFGIDARIRLLHKARMHSIEPPRKVRDRTLLGLVAGGLVGVLLGSGFEEEARLMMPMLSVGVGTGAGFLMGALGR